MKKLLVLCAALAVAPLAAGCSSTGAEVSVLASDTVPVRAGSTYAWAAAPAGSTTDPRVANDIIDQRIRLAIERNFAGKGYVLVADPAAANVTVQYFAAVRDTTELRLETWGATGVRWGYYGPPRMESHTVDYAEGVLMIDITDRMSGQLAWRGVSKKRLYRGDATQGELDRLVGELTRDLPET